MLKIVGTEKRISAPFFDWEILKKFRRKKSKTR